MYNVMIVDDELWFRSYLKELIDQSGSEFLVCAQAKRSQTASFRSSLRTLQTRRHTERQQVLRSGTIQTDR